MSTSFADKETRLLIGWRRTLFTWCVWTTTLALLIEIEYHLLLTYLIFSQPYRWVADRFPGTLFDTLAQWTFGCSSIVLCCANAYPAGILAFNRRGSWWKLLIILVSLLVIAECATWRTSPPLTWAPRIIQSSAVIFFHAPSFVWNGFRVITLVAGLATPIAWLIVNAGRASQPRRMFVVRFVTVHAPG